LCKPLAGRQGLATEARVAAEGTEDFIATTERGMTADEIKAELLTLRQRMFEGRRVADIQRLGRAAKDLVRQLKEAKAEIPKSNFTNRPQNKGTRIENGLLHDFAYSPSRRIV
jgi:hypothetical protein